MATRYQIHPAIGIARVGDSPDQFYIAPETPAGLPIACDADGRTTRGSDGREETTSDFKDECCRVKRQAARFKIYVYDDDSPDGRPLQPGDAIQGVGSSGKLIDVEWTAYLANKKAVWYRFQELEGEHGYAPDHPLRNADVADPDERQNLIIDPGPQTVWNSGRPGRPRRASFADGANPSYAAVYPPPLEPRSVHTLGELVADGDLGLLVLGGHGDSGSYKTGFGQPAIEEFANNDGWFDDVSDGPVTAKLTYWDEEDQQVRYAQVEQPAWVLVGQPGYVPELLNVITLDDLVYDVAVRCFGYDTYLYGPGPYDREPSPPLAAGTPEMEAWRRADKGYNPNYYPLFFKQIWPLLQRPAAYQWVTTLLGQSFNPHNSGPGGNFNLCQISIPPYDGEDPEERDLNREMRRYIYHSLRQPGSENKFANEDRASRLYGAPLMPLLCGDNPLNNNLPSKFLRLTETQIFLLRQWSQGRFVNECKEGWIECSNDPAGDCPVPPSSYWNAPAASGAELDRVALAGCLGGSFCPGGEVSWILRNPRVFQAPYRVRADTSFLAGLETSSTGTTPGVEIYERPQLSQPLSPQPTPTPAPGGLEPGDLTKYGPLPWQADFNECSTQPIDVTYEQWNEIFPADPATAVVNETLWWPAHRPLQVQILDEQGEPESAFVQWARGIPQTLAGDLKMVTAWRDLGFVIEVDLPGGGSTYAEVQRNNAALGGPSGAEGCTPDSACKEKKGNGS